MMHRFLLRRSITFRTIERNFCPPFGGRVHFFDRFLCLTFLLKFTCCTHFVEEELSDLDIFNERNEIIYGSIYEIVMNIEEF